MKNLGLWILLLISALFSVAGIFMILDAHTPKDRMSGIFCLVFFLLCGFAVIQTLCSRRQNRLHAADVQVTIAPGVKLPVKKGRAFGLGMAIAVVGGLATSEGYYGADRFMEGFGLFVAFVGLAFIFLLVTGLLGSQYLSFESEGFRIGDRGGSVLFTWDNISKVLPAEFQSNEALFLWVKDVEALAATAQGNGRQWRSEAVRKSVGRVEKWMGYDWMILTASYGLNATLLARTVATYVADPQVRSGLE